MTTDKEQARTHRMMEGRISLNIEVRDIIIADKVEMIKDGEAMDYDLKFMRESINERNLLKSVLTGERYSVSESLTEYRALLAGAKGNKPTSIFDAAVELINEHGKSMSNKEAV
jgi:hypothetical protein